MSELGLIGVEAKFSKKEEASLLRAVDRANDRSLSSAAFIVRKIAAKGIKGRKNKDIASPVGTPPFTHGGFIRRALRYHVDRPRDEALVGFQYSVIGDVAHTHEFGAVEEGRQYPERPTVRPALEAGLGLIAGQWQGSIGN